MVTQVDASHGARAPGRPSAGLLATRLWLFDTELDVDGAATVDDPRGLLLASVAARRAAAEGVDGPHVAGRRDAVERAVAELAIRLGVATDPPARGGARRAQFRSDAPLRRVTSIDEGRHGVTVTVSGALDAVLPCCTLFLDDQGRGVPLTQAARSRLRAAVARDVADGRRVLAVAHRAVGVGRPAPSNRREAETDLVLIGLVTMTSVTTPARPRRARPVQTIGDRAVRAGDGGRRA